MKKLMTMIAAVATAFGLYADDANFYANSFEVEAEGVSENTWTPGTGWSTEQTEAFTLEAQVAKEALPYYTGAERRDGSDGKDNKFAAQDLNAKYLKLETGKNTLARDIAAGQVYLDQLVKFTGFEEEQTEFAAGTKIAVWLSAIEQDGTDPEAAGYVAGETNLYVTVGNGDTEAKVQIDPTSVGLDEFLPETWYRVTIKSLGDVIANKTEYGVTTQLGFVVFINGKQAAIVDKVAYHNYAGAFSAEAAKLYADGKLFTAIDTTDAVLATVGYQGIGALDDLVLSQESPDFDSKVQFTVADMAGVELVKVTDAEGNELEQYLVMPGSDVRIYIKAKDGYRIDGLTGEYVTKTVTMAGQVITFTDDDFTVVEGAVMVVNADETVTNLYAEAELGVLTGLANGDTATVLKGCSVKKGDDTLYKFTQGTTIAVAEGGVWTVNVGSEGTTAAKNTLTDNVGAMPGKSITVSFENADKGQLSIQGTVYGNAGTATTIDVNGKVTLVGNLNVGNAYDTMGNGAGAVLKAESISFGGLTKYTIALDGFGKVMTKDGTLTDAQITVPAGKQLDISKRDEAGYITYSIKQETGFAIILASGPVYYNTLQDAFNAAEAGQTVAIMADVDISDVGATLVAGKQITFDLNGHTIKVGEGIDTNLKVYGAMTFVDSSDLATGKLWTDVAYTGAATGHGAIRVGAIGASGASFTMNSGRIDAVIADDPANKGQYAISVKGNGTQVTINGGTINAGWYAIAGNGTAGHNDADTVVTVNGGTLTSAKDYAIYWPNLGTVEVKDGVVYGAAGGIYAQNGEIIVSGGTVTSNGQGETGTWGDGTGGAGNVAINVNAKYGDTSLEITGGKIIAEGGAVTVAAGAAHDADIAISGGAFKGAVDPTFFARGFALGPVDPVTGFATTVAAVAEIDTVGYASLDAAIDAAAATDTVTLLKDLTLTATLDIAKSVAIDLNAKTITFAANLATGIYAHDAGEIVIENGKFVSADGRTNIAGSKAIYFLRTSAEFTNVEIDAPGFDYVLTHMGNIADQGKNRSEYWTTEVPYTLDCDKVAVKGNGSLFHLEYVTADLDSNCTATQYTDKGYFSEAHQAAIYSSCGAVVTVNGGTYSAVNALQTGNLGGTIVVKDGAFNGNIKSWMLDEDTRDFANVNKANIQIEGGKFTGNFVYAANCSAESPLLTVVISGGDFSDTKIPVEFIKPEEHKVAKWVDSKIPDYVTPGYDDETFDITFTDAAEWTNVVKTVYNQTPVAPTAPTKEGYEFKGWDKEIVPATEATTYTAQYTANTYGINYTWVDNDGAAVTALDNTLPENFTFGGDAIELKAEMVTLTEAYTAVAFTPDTVTTDEAKEFAVTVTLTKKADEPKVDPEQPIPVPTGKTAEQVAEEMNQKGIANYLNIPTVVTDETAYTAMFEAKADGKGAVIIDLKSDVAKEIADQLANEETSGSMLNPDATTSEVTITAKPGLFYGIKAVGDVTAISTANGQNWVQAAGNSVNVVRPTVEGNAAFFQAVCSPKDPQSNPAN